MFTFILKLKLQDEQLENNLCWSCVYSLISLLVSNVLVTRLIKLYNEFESDYVSSSSVNVLKSLITKNYVIRLRMVE